MFSVLRWESERLMDHIILYSTGCPKCEVLKKKIEKSGIPYTENQSVDDMLALGITQAPVLSVNGALMPFRQAVEWINRSQLKGV